MTQSAASLRGKIAGRDAQRKVSIEVDEDPEGLRRSQSAPNVRRPHTAPELGKLSVSPSVSASAGGSPAGRGSRPSTACSAPSRCSRFSAEEKACFKRLHVPSSTCDAKALNYFATTGRTRQAMTGKGYSQLPVNKGGFYNHPGVLRMDMPKMRKNRMVRRGAAFEHRAKHQLSIEAPTASILEDIYPASPGGTRTAAHAFGGGSPKSNADTDGSPRFGFPPMTPGSCASPMGRSGRRSSTLQVSTGSNPIANTGASNAQTAQADVEDPKQMMVAFRAALLAKYVTLKEAFDAFTRDVPPERELSKPDWRHLLGRHGFDQFAGRVAINQIFKLLDFSGDGFVSLKEFHISLEVVAPVRTIEGLRRKWLAKGFKSMTAAIRKMDDDDAAVSARRLDLPAFGSFLEMTNIEDEEEHRAIFNSLLVDDSGTVSLEELHSAIASVSPSLLLEDIRDRLCKRYRTTDFDRVFQQMDEDHSGQLSFKEFVLRVGNKLNLRPYEAEKAFRELDADGHGGITMQEMKNALAIVEPSLFVEDIRWKVRQRFHSIQEALNKEFADDVLDGLHTQVTLSLPKFQSVLAPLGLMEAETGSLFHLLDVDGDGELTALEFMSGVQRFAPGTIFEDLRIRCCQMYGHVHTAFEAVTKRRHELVGFDQLLKKLAVLNLVDPARADDFNMQAVFDLLDVNHEGLGSISRIVVALCSCGAGSRIRLPPDERRARAREEIATDMAPMRRRAHELKVQVRWGLDWDGRQMPDFLQGPTGHQGSSPAHGASHGPTPATSPTANAAGEDKKGLARSASSPAVLPPSEDKKDLCPKLRVATQEVLPEHVRAVPQLVADCRSRSEFMVHDVQNTWGAVWKDVRNEIPMHLRPGPVLEKDLQSYFQSAAMKLSQTVPFTQKTQSYYETYKSARIAQGGLKPGSKARAAGAPAQATAETPAITATAAAS